MANEQRKMHEQDITWDDYVALAEQPGFNNQYKDQIFFVTDIEFSDAVEYLLNKVNELMIKYDKLVTAYQEDHPDFDPDAEEEAGT